MTPSRPSSPPSMPCWSAPARVLAGAVPPRAQDPLALVYDLDWDEGCPP